MPGRLGPRFALEAGFLIVLAVLAGVADLSWPMVVLVMGAAWLLVTIAEVARWKEGPRLPAPVPRPYSAATGQAPVDDVTRVIPPAERGPAEDRRDLANDLSPAKGESRKRKGGRADSPDPTPRHVRVISPDEQGKE